MTSPADSVRLFDFHGGIRPEERKRRSSETTSQVAPAPEHLFFPVQSPHGRALQYDATEAQRLVRGQVVTRDPSGRHPPMHTDADATTREIIKVSLSGANPTAIPMLKLDLNPDAEPADATTPADESTAERVTELLQQPPARLIARIFDAGIIGMGGAGFPTAHKLSSGNTIETLIINGVECEPYITCDDRLMRERAVEIMLGIRLIRHCAGARNVIIAIEDNKPAAIEAMRQARDKLFGPQFELEHDQNERNSSAAAFPLSLAKKAHGLVRVVAIPTKYPAGGERQLIEVLCAKQVPQGGLPVDLGLIVQNVATAFAVYEALLFDRPLTRRLVTLTGDAFAAPGNYWLRIGTPMSHILKFAGFDPARCHRVVVGGPMMGHTLIDLNSPVLKTTNCIIAASAEEMPSAPPTRPCIRCGLCVTVCPANLLPQQLHWHIRAQEWDKVQRLNLEACIECGACAWVCPSQIPLVDFYLYGKDQLRARNHTRHNAEQARLHHTRKQQRLDRLQQEKATRRKANARRAAQQNSAPETSKTTLGNDASTARTAPQADASSSSASAVTATPPSIEREPKA